MLRVIPLGGLGEVGLNCLVLEHGDEQLLVDCGLMFPRANQPGVEVVLPDFSYLRSEPSRLKGIVLTHAHEDHLGALPWLLQELPVPVYGTPFTLGVAAHRCEEAGVAAEFRAIGPLQRFELAGFSVEPVPVAHSIPESVGLVVRTASGTLVHSGDFKLDGEPLDGWPTDLGRLAEVSEEGVDVLLADSTNAEVPGVTAEERVVEQALDRLVGRASGRVFIALFGSHLHRVSHILRLAARHRRRVAVAGRSLIRNIELARRLGLLPIPDGLLVPAETGRDLAPHELLVLCTGTQAEPYSALSTFLSPESGPLRIGAGDVVVLSARTIPGNEPAVTALIDRALALGAVAAYPEIEPGVHVSGHAAQEELKRLITTVRPRHFVPIHGALRHLTRHSQLAADAGLPAGATTVMVDGDVLGFELGRPARLGRVPSGQVLMRREGSSPLDPATVSERRALSEAGVVVVSVVMELGSGRVRIPPTTEGRGLNHDEAAALPLAAEGARLALEQVSEAVRGDDERVREELVRGVRRVFKQLLGARPQVVPIVLRS